MPSLSGWFRMRHNWKFMLVGRRFSDLRICGGESKSHRAEIPFYLPESSRKYLRWNSLMINCNPSAPLRKSVWRRLNKAKTALRREGRSGCKEEAKKSENWQFHQSFRLPSFFCLHSSKPPSGECLYGVWACVRKISRSRLVRFGFKRKICNVCWTNGWLLEAGISTDMRSNSMRGSQQGQTSIHSSSAKAYYRVTLSHL